ncbi:Cycloisomaltooligosaccharide glucanotransferase precursor [compost metagenome]
MISRLRIKIMLLTIIGLVTCLLTGIAANAATSGIVKRVYTDKARYDTGDAVTVSVVLTNDSGSTFNDNVVMTIYQGETQKYTSSQAVNLASGNTTTINFTWTAPSVNHTGYFVKIAAGASAGKGATAIDVSNDWIQYPRYGFMSEFPVGESSSNTDARVKQTVEDYHTVAFQLYDWMWRHENMIKRTGGVIDSSWQDWSSKLTLSWPTIQNMISSMHSYKAAAMPYTMSYAALEDYASISGVSNQWGMFYDASHANQLVFDFVDNNPSTNLWLFNPASTGWQNHIYAQYRDILNTAGFDGIHLDQMGQRSDPYAYNGSTIDLDNSFSGFINNLRTNLDSNSLSNKVVTFNVVNGAVDGWAAADVTKNSNTDFDYSEIWEGSDDYIELKDYVDYVRKNDGGKALVLAAYMNYEENLGTRYEAESAALNGVSTNTNHTGYTGTGFVDGFGDNGDYVDFTISAPEAGKYALVFRFANDTGSKATRNVYVDNVLVKEIDFLDQADWNTWAFDAYTTVELTAGSHTIRLKKDTANTGFINLDSLTLGTFEENSVRLSNAAIAASGAFHIEMGEGDQLLGHPYFPNNSKQMRSTLREGMKDHYNFITAYENLLFDADVINNDSGGQFVSITGQTVSGDAAGGTIWQQTKRSPNYDIVHLINLTNNDTKWRNAANAPTNMTNLVTKIYIGNEETISNVYLASPDINHGGTQELTFTTSTDSNGKYVSFTVPSLKYWDMIYMKRTFTVPANDIYQAESAIKTNVSTNTDHTGYTGTGFVDQNASSGDGVSFISKATTDDDYVLRFRYANGGSNATRDVYVDGKFAGTVAFKSTANWDTWAYGELTVHMKEGLHSIVLWYNSTNSGAINLDHLDLDKTYIWQFDRLLTSVPAGYRITFRAGLPGWVHWGVNGWTSLTDTGFVTNGSSNVNLDVETSIGPFSTGTTVNATFLWDDNNNGILETGTDRWEGTNYTITIP